MALVTIEESILCGIGDSIRGKNGEQTTYAPSQMPAAIDAIESNKSSIIVAAPTGSSVTVSCGEITLSAEENNGVWTFKGCDIGTWTVHASLGSQEANTEVEITEEGQLMRYEVIIAYSPYASDFQFYLDEALTIPATLGADYQIVYDNDEEIPQELWSTAKNWKIRCLVTLYCVPLRDGVIDVFCVGAGGAGEIAGGGGGYTNTGLSIELQASVTYPVIIGAGVSGNDGGNTSAFGISAPGGKVAITVTSNNFKGGDGGSGGGAYNGSQQTNGIGGSDGSNGASNSYGTGGKGQGTTTREFGEEFGKLYAGGGSGGGTVKIPGGDGGGGDGGSSTDGLDRPTDGEENTGGGGGGTTKDYAGKGGSGIVVFRNTREAA